MTKIIFIIFLIISLSHSSIISKDNSNAVKFDNWKANFRVSFKPVE